MLENATLDRENPEALDFGAGTNSNDEWRVLAEKYSAEIDAQNVPGSERAKIHGLHEKIQGVIKSAAIEIQKMEQPDYQPEKLVEAIAVSKKDGQLTYLDKDGRPQALTLGELLTDGDYGLQYYLDESVDVETRKRYLFEETERQAKHIYDQMELIRLKNDPDIDEWKRDGYNHMLARLESGDEPFGIKIEKQVKNFFKKMEIDNHAPFHVIDTNPKMDMDRKIDFILEVHDNTHGMKVEEGNLGGKLVDVQFTVDTTPEVDRYKRMQLERVRKQADLRTNESIIKVTMDGTQFRFFNNRWEADKTPGGPDKSWRSNVRWELLFKALKNVMSREEIDRIWLNKHQAPVQKIAA